MTPPDAPFCTGAILAGGQGTRMGQPKEGVLMPDGRRMIEHVIEPLSGVCPKIVIVGACRGFAPLRAAANVPLPLVAEGNETPLLLHLLDDEESRGPLFAIATLLKSGIDQEGYIVCACDQPFLQADLLRLLVAQRSDRPRIFQQKPDTMLTPFPGYYPVNLLSEIEKGFSAGEYSICALLQSSPVSFIPLPKEQERFLKNINRPSDLGSL